MKDTISVFIKKTDIVIILFYMNRANKVIACFYYLYSVISFSKVRNVNGIGSAFGDGTNIIINNMPKRVFYYHSQII